MKYFRRKICLDKYLHLQLIDRRLKNCSPIEAVPVQWWLVQFLFGLNLSSKRESFDRKCVRQKVFFFAFKISYHIFHRSRCLNITFGYNWSLGRGNSRGSTWCTCMCQYWRLNLNDIHIRRCFWSGNFKHFYAFRWLHICHYYRFLWTDIANNRCSFGKIQKWFKSFHVICPYPFFCISCRLSRFSFVDSSVLSISISEIPPFFSLSLKIYYF